MIRQQTAAPYLHRILLAGILVTALAARGLRCTEGLPYLHTWDEPQTASTALSIIKTGDLNPHFFNYGSLLIYLNVAVDVVHYFYLMGHGETDTSQPGSLPSVWAIETEHDTGYHWTISHPTFYLWNRLLTALMGTASVLLAYFLARDLKGRWSGVLAAGMIAGVDFHIEHSALVTPNVPASFFTLVAVLLGVRYLKRQSPLSLIGSAAACGLAAATKYNAGISIVVPLVALGCVWRKHGPEIPRWLPVAVVLAPMAAFFVGTPYALFDLPHFLNGVGYEVRHYEVLGHPGIQIEPGVPHLLFQLGTIARGFGVLPSILAVIGLGAALATAAGWVTFCFPLVYLVFMSWTRVAEHRNFVGLYVFASVAFGCGVVAVGDLLARTRLAPGRLRLVRAGVALLATALCVIGLTSSLRFSWSLAQTAETRSVTVDRINAEAAAAPASTPRVGVASELRFHPLDLSRLKVPHEEASFFDLFCAQHGSYDMIVTARTYRDDRPEEKESVELMNAMVKAAPSVALTVGSDHWFHIDYSNANPAILVIGEATGESAAPRPRQEPPASITCSPMLGLGPDQTDRPPGPESETGAELNGGKPVVTEWVPAAPGSHAMVWYATGKVDQWTSPQMACKLRRRVAGTGIVAEGQRRLFGLNTNETAYAMTFDATDRTEVSLSCQRVLGKNISLWSVRSIEVPRPDAAGAATTVSESVSVKGGVPK